ncbi:MAG: hypothetical protein HS115_06550 [Spirochaetales bacterium]|nr:hypothetical protein [Spirochaetales bacterium]
MIRMRWKSMLGSLLTAIMLASYVKYARTDTRVLQVRVEKPALGRNLVFSETLPSFLHVRLSGPVELMEFPVDDLRIQLYNPGPEPGSNVFQTRLVPPLPEGIQAEYIKDMAIALDTLTTRSLPVYPLIESRIPGSQPGFVTVQPEQLRVQGPRGRLEQMVRLSTRTLRLEPSLHLNTHRVLLGEMPEHIVLAPNQSFEVEVQLRLLPALWKERLAYRSFEKIAVRCSPAPAGIALDDPPLVTIYIRDEAEIAEKDLTPSIPCPVRYDEDAGRVFPSDTLPDLPVHLRLEKPEDLLAIEPFRVMARFKRDAPRKVNARVIREAFGDHVIQNEP